MGNELYLLGAGFSKAVDPNMPTLSDLSNEVWDKSAWTSKNLSYVDSPANYPNSLSDYRVGSYDDDIGGLFSFLSRKKPWLNKVQRLEEKRLYVLLRQWIRARIANGEYEYLNKIKDASLFPAWGEKLIKKWDNNNNTVVTLNYDTLLERILIYKKSGQYDKAEQLLNDYYPLPVKNAYLHDYVAENEGAGFDLLKLHGSTNWYKRTNEETLNFTPLVSYFSQPTSLSFTQKIKKERQYKRFVQDQQPFIVPPTIEKETYLDNAVVQHLWQKALNRAQESDTIICLGYSFPIADRITKQFFHQLAQSCDSSKTLIPVNFKQKVSRGQAMKFTDHLQKVLPSKKLIIKSKYLYDKGKDINPIAKFVNDWI